MCAAFMGYIYPVENGDIIDNPRGYFDYKHRNDVIKDILSKYSGYQIRIKKVKQRPPVTG